METLISFFTQTWSWYVSGTLIALVMFLLLYSGREFGVSATMRAICSASGAGRRCDFFDFAWRDQIWNLVFAAGAVIGGFIAQQFLMGNEVLQLSEATLSDMKALGITNTHELIPSSVFSWEGLLTLRGFIFMVIGGFLIGFGARYAGGCTSGHAISGLSNLQIPSLIAVVGFFIGGLFMTHILLPFLIKL